MAGGAGARGLSSRRMDLAFLLVMALATNMTVPVYTTPLRRSTGHALGPAITGRVAGSRKRAAPAGKRSPGQQAATSRHRRGGPAVAEEGRGINDVRLEQRRQVIPAVDAEFPIGAGQVLLDRADGHVEPPGDLPVRVAVRGQRGHPQFGVAQLADE